MGARNPFEHSTYKGCRIMRNDGRGYWAECKGMIAKAPTIAGIRRTIASVVDAPTISWRVF
jgi:hypothetical protein